MPNPTLELKLFFDGALAEKAVLVGDELRAALARALRELGKSMGLAIEPVLLMQAAASQKRPLRIRIGEHAIGYSAELWDATQAETGTVEAITALILEALKIHLECWLECWLPDAVPDALLDAIREEAKSDLPAPRLREILRTVLRQRLSLERRAVVARTIAEGQARRQSDAEIAESLIARLHPRSLTLLFSPADRTPLGAEDALRTMAEAIEYELGLRLPEISFAASPDLAPGTIALRINHLATPAFPRPDEQEIPAVCALELRRHAACFLDAEAVDAALARLDEEAPILTAALAERHSLESLTAILRGLLAEQVSIRDLRAIANRLVAYDEISGDPFQSIIFDDRLVVDDRLRDLVPDEWERLARRTQFVRAGLQRSIGFQYSRGSGSLSVYLLDTDLEARIREHAVAEARGLSDGLVRADEREALLDAVRGEFLPPPEDGARPVVLTASPIRRALRRLIADEFPSLAVLSYDELPADMNLQPLARIFL